MKQYSNMTVTELLNQLRHIGDTDGELRLRRMMMEQQAPEPAPEPQPSPPASPFQTAVHPAWVTPPTPAPRPGLAPAVGRPSKRRRGQRPSEPTMRARDVLQYIGYCNLEDLDRSDLSGLGRSLRMIYETNTGDDAQAGTNQHCRYPRSWVESVGAALFREHLIQNPRHAASLLGGQS